MQLRTDLLLTNEHIKLNDNVTIINPTLREILDFGEERYYTSIQQLTATSYQYMLFLDENGVDYRDVDDYSIFITFGRSLPQSETKLILGDLDLSKLHLVKSKADTSKYDLVNDEGKVIIDESIYHQIVAYIHLINNTTREYLKAGNDATYNYYIEEAKLKAEFIKRKGKQPFESILLPLISSLCNHPYFKYDHSKVKDISIYILFDSLKRIQAYEHYSNLMTGIYAGTIDIKSIDKKELNWFRKL